MTAQQPQYPQEKLVNSTTITRLILTLVCPWLVFILANLGANFYLRSFPENRGYWLIQQKWSMLMNLNKPVDWLVMGDSSCNHGVIPQILEEELSGRAINLCTIGDSLVLNDAWMLSKYIKKHGVPKNVIIVHVYDIWQREINWNVTSQTPLKWGYWDNLEPKIDLSLAQKKDVFLNKYIPLYSQNTSLKQVIENRERLFRGKNYQLQPKGFMPVTKSNSWRVKNDFKQHIESTANTTDASFSQTNQKAIDTIIQLAEKHDINIYLVNSPIYGELYQNPDFQTYYNKVQTELDRISQRSHKVRRVMIEPMTFNKQEMENVDHITVPAASDYTKKLAQEIKLLD